MAAAFTLPVVQPKRAPEPVIIDLFSHKQETPPKPPDEKPPEPPIVKEQPKPEEKSPQAKEKPPEFAMREPEHPPDVVPSKPEEMPSEQKEPGKVDLTLHALPSGSETAATVPNGTGTFGTTLGSGPQKKKWSVDAGNPLTGKLAEEKEDRFPLTPSDGGYVYKGKTWHARIARDGRVSFDDKTISDFKGLSGSFDLTDMVMKAKHNDPYRAEKDAFMKHTEALRKKLQADAQKERVTHSLALLNSHLDEIWHSPTHDAQYRRKVIYETWLDAALADTEGNEGGKDACNMIEVYVRRHMPAGSDDAYGDEELEKLNSGKRVKFAPYR